MCNNDKSHIFVFISAKSDVNMTCVWVIRAIPSVHMPVRAVHVCRITHWEIWTWFLMMSWGLPNSRRQPAYFAGRSWDWPPFLQTGQNRAPHTSVWPRGLGGPAACHWLAMRTGYHMALSLFSDGWRGAGPHDRQQGAEAAVIFISPLCRQSLPPHLSPSGLCGRAAVPWGLVAPFEESAFYFQ